MTANALHFSEAQPPKPAPEPPQEHQTYPLVMTHPNARKATLTGKAGTEKRDSMGRVIPGEFWGWEGTPDVLPPVTVNNHDQEMMHYAKGYRRGGISDIAAFSNLQCGAEVKPAAFEKYPMWVGQTLVNNEEEEAAARGGQTTAAPSAPAGNSGDAQPTPRPRHVASPRKPSKAAPINSKRSEAMKARWAARKAEQAAQTP